jgi:hypothetical protein
MADTDTTQTGADPNVVLWTGRLADATRRVQEYRERLQQAQATRARLGGDTPPPETRPMTGGRWPWQTEPNPVYDQWAEADSLVSQLEPVAAGTAKNPTQGPAKAFSDALQEAEEAQAKLASAERAAPAAPARSTINGVLHERQPDGTWKPVETAAPVAIAGGEGVDPRLVGKPRGTTVRQEVETGLDGNKYTVEYFYSPQGTKQGLASDKEHPPVPLGGAFGTDPTAGITLATAQVNLDRARQQLAEATSPEARRLAQLKVDQAQFDLEQSRAKAPLEQATAQLAYDRARTAYENETDPVAKETRRVALEQARVALQQAQQTLARGQAPQVIQPGTGRVIVRQDPLTGELTTQPNPAYTPEAAERETLELEALRRGTLPQNAYAAYTQERSRLQQAGQGEIDRLRELQRQGALSEAQARQQWEAWLGPRQAQLEGLRASAEEAQRAERTGTEELQRAEEARAEALNRQREQLGLAAGQEARQTWMGLAPQIRTPQFLAQMGQSVADMAARANAPSAEAAAALPRGSTFSPDTFRVENFRGAIPDLDAVSKAATERALAAISPAVARKIGLSLPALPSGDGLTSLMGNLPYAGPLLRAPTGATPLPGQEAIDLGTGRARTYYSPTSFLDWDIPYSPGA